MRATEADEQPSPSLAMRADATRIARAAGDVLDAGRALAAGTRPTLSTLDVDPDWFGPLPSSSALAGSHAAALADTQAALDVLDSTLDKDADGLYQVAFSVLVTDQDAANRLGGR